MNPLGKQSTCKVSHGKVHCQVGLVPLRCMPRASPFRGRKCTTRLVMYFYVVYQGSSPSGVGSANQVGLLPLQSRSALPGWFGTFRLYAKPRARTCNRRDARTRNTSPSLTFGEPEGETNRRFVRKKVRKCTPRLVRYF